MESLNQLKLSTNINHYIINYFLFHIIHYIKIMDHLIILIIINSLDQLFIILQNYLYLYFFIINLCI